jgi:hypothetical protein
MTILLIVSSIIITMKLQKTGPYDAELAVNAGTVALVGIATSINQALGVAVGMAASLFGSALARRQDRAKELLDFVSNNISQFSDQVLNDIVFQDGLIFLLEKYIRERNDDKREILQQILLGYCKAPSLLDFPIEEMSDLVNRIRMSDVAVFREALQAETTELDGRNPSFMLKQDPNSVSRLIYFGLLHEDRSQNGPQIRDYDHKNFLYVWISPTGRSFAEYLVVNSRAGEESLKKKHSGAVCI